MVWSCDLTMAGTYGVLTDKGSEVIKGVISGLKPKIVKNIQKITVFTYYIAE